MSQPQKVLDYEAIQLKVGLEVHQQLSTGTKLFCACPPFTGGETGDGQTTGASDRRNEFSRILRPVSSELGEVDEAALFESRRDIKVRYITSHGTSCLVEADEEPPHPISVEGIDTALIFSLALKSRIIDEIHVMRKIVVDGSNTSGFQRTAVISLGGELSYGDKVVGVQTISLEEDAARAVNEERSGNRNSSNAEKTYALDRLGTPLVEVALAPIEGTPEDVESAALTLGRMMRSTRRIARGLGTIRQDLNISVMNGRVIEVKGVQRLDQIKRVVLYEAARQKFFYDLAMDIRQAIGNRLAMMKMDVTDTFSDTKSNVIKKALSTSSGSVTCVVIRNFKGYIGKENEFHSRLGKELGAIAKSYGLGGIFHSDELPNYGITEEEIQKLRETNGINSGDAFVIIAGDKQKVLRAVEAVDRRLQFSTIGVPAETRAAGLDGETSFLRPRPGAARMYPETDIPLIHVTKERIERLRNEIPEPWEKQVSEFSEKYDLPRQLGEPLYDSDRRELFELVLSSTKLSSRFVASTLVDTLLALGREGIAVNSLPDSILLGVFKALSEGKFAKEALPEVIRQLFSAPGSSLEEALSRSGISSISRAELDNIVDEVISQNADLVRAKGPKGAQSTLMGKVMQRVRGRADGSIVNETLSSHLAKLAEQ